MIKDYSSFKQDFEIESFINESMVYLSPTFIKQIQKIDSPISQELIDIQGVDIKDDISFIDFDNTPGMLSFKTMKNLKKSLEDITGYLKSSGDSLAAKYDSIGNDFEKSKELIDDFFKNSMSTITQSRNPLKIGRFIGSAFPGKFTPKQIEDFTNKYKALQISSAEKFIIVEGDEIAHWYKSENYKKLESSLGTSCMKDKSASYFDIYTKNPDVCKMLCLVENDLLLGRALLWKPELIKKVRQDYTKSDDPVEIEWFMDRQYAISDDVIQKFRDYAIAKGWAYRAINSFSEVKGIVYKGKTFNCDMKVQLKDINYRQFPFVDTFRKFEPNDCFLINDDNQKEWGYYLLNSTGGGYSETGQDEDEDDNYVWSEYHGENIDSDYAVWSDIYDSYLYIDEAVEISSGSRRYHDWYPQDASEIRYDGWNEEYIHEEDAIYSEEYDYYILEDESISVVNEIQQNGDCNQDMYLIHEGDQVFIKYSKLEGTLWFDTLSKEFDNYDVHRGILKSALFIDEDERKWYPKDFCETVHEIEGRDNVWLSTNDMGILGLDEWIRYKEIDKISYSQSLMDNGVINELISAIKTKMKGNPEHSSIFFEKNRLEQLVKIQNEEFPDYGI
jgi:hypothetical protein